MIFKLLTVLFVLLNVFYNSQCREITRDTAGLEEKLSEDAFHEAKLVEERHQLHAEKEHDEKLQEDKLHDIKLHEVQERKDHEHEEHEHKEHMEQEHKEHKEQEHKKLEHEVHELVAPYEKESAPEEKSSESESDEWLGYDSDELDWEFMEGWSSEEYEYEEEDDDCEEKKFFQLHQLLEFLRSWVTIFFDEPYYY